MSGKKKRIVLGVGLDGDGHKRITQAEDFAIVGGTEKTHAAMTETSIKTMEELKRKGLNLQTVDPKQLRDIVHKSLPK